MGNTVTIRKVNFEDIQYAIKNKNKCILINTLGSNEQVCLIKNTVPVDAEEKLINKYLSEKVNINIIVYDKNANAPNLMKKYNQLINLGFINVYIYPGGLFEWLLLQDVYGKDIFPTTYNELDILKFKGKSIFTSYLIRDLD
tara:strand:- start:645 stop:1070 length:426 start_codon:yes stop_codon:yes gene_type:complete